MTVVAFILALIAAATPTRTPTTTPTPVPPSFTFHTPAPLPTPVGSLVVTTAVLTHGQPITFTELEPNAWVYVNGVLLGTTNSAGSFTITFPAAGTYAVDVGDYPEKSLVVN